MLRRMRRRFIVAAMTAMMLVMTAIALVINLWNYSVTVRRQDRVIEEIWESENENSSGKSVQRTVSASRPREGRRPPFPRENPEMQDVTRFFIVRVDAERMDVQVSMDYAASVTEEEAAGYGQKALNTGRDAGYYQNYRYRVFQTDTGDTVIFLNTGRERQFMKTLLMITLITVVISLVLVFGLVVLFSRRAIGPYMKNIEQQKRFITDAGHELKTPITSIAASADILAMEHGADEWTENIQIQTRRLTKLTENLVRLSRLDEEVPFPEKQQFSLSEAVWEIAEPFEAMAKARGKQYVQNISEGLELFGDRASIQQMISVLLDNALKYSDEHGEIRLDLYRKNRKVYLEVFNTCQLENTSELDRLFDRFYRADASRSRSTGGSGIGLSIARAVAEHHGGKTSVSSSDGTSICFQVILKGKGLSA